MKTTLLSLLILLGSSCPLFAGTQSIEVVNQLKQENDYCQIIYGTDLALVLCGVPSETAEVLKEPYAALSARFKMLMGYELSKEAYLKKDPLMPLDFSKAPNLDLIILDTLQITKDFVGILHLRMLKYHIKQGTRVYFMTSRALLLPHEIFWLRNFRKKYPQMHFSMYKKGPEKLNFKELLGVLHRNNHVKALLTYSRSHPEHNAFIVGGRNVSEMYFYPKKPDNSAYPYTIQWDKDHFYKWCYYDDFDFKFKGTTATEALARSLIAYNETRNWDKYQKPMVNPQSPDATMSFYLSYPFQKRKGELEQLFVQWIDSATTSLEITSPYLNLTRALKAALLRAQRRGVDIQITTNLDFSNELMPFLVQPGMNRAIRQVSKMFKIYYYSSRRKTLHAKAVLIDDRKLILGSANFNQRSFLHDTEISYVLTDARSVANFKAQYTQHLSPLLKRLTPEALPTKSIMESLIKPLMPEM